ncbi:hypothetical protein BOX15_Mlig018479g1, partial [Macrostomum lignano]
ATVEKQQSQPQNQRARLDGLVPRHCQRTCGTVPLFNFKQSTELLTGLRLLYHDADGVARLSTSSSGAETAAQAAAEEQQEQQKQQQQLDSFQCATCGEQFSSCAEQREHFRSDWHLYNRHRVAKQQACISEAEFDQLINGGGAAGPDGSLASSDLSSLSGDEDEDDSDSSSSENDNNSYAKNNDAKAGGQSDGSFASLSRHQLLSQSGRLFFLNKDREYVSIARCLFDLPAPSEESLLSRAAALPRMLRWAILMLAGGHFAGAIFDESGRAVAHKTFHQYAVRKRQGGLQSARDSQSGGASGPKSAGANLRRRCEAHLREKIQNLLASWTDELNACHFVLIRISKQQQAIFLGPPSPIAKSDPRVRRIPISTRRPTHSELVRVHRELACLHVYDSDADAASIGQAESRQLVNRIESGLRIVSQSPDGNLYLKRHSASMLPSNQSAATEDSIKDDSKLSSQNRSPPTRRRQQFPMSEGHSGRAPVPSGVARRKKKSSSSSTSAAAVAEQSVKTDDNGDSNLQVQLCDEEPLEAGDDDQPAGAEASQPADWALQNQLFTAVACADLETLDQLLSELASSEPDSVAERLRQPLGQKCATLLHLAASNSCGRTVLSLLESGADPCQRDLAGRTPYQLAGNKSVREAFRKFMAKRPDWHDYASAGIPAPLTPEQLEARRLKEADKKRAAKAAKRDRDRAKRAAEAAAQAEADERERFQTLSDTQKMALAAERRLLAAAAASQQSAGGTNQKPLILSRCFQCAADITGKVPFHYDRYEFCSTNCLRRHRDKTAAETTASRVMKK